MNTKSMNENTERLIDSIYEDVYRKGTWRQRKR